MMQPKPQPWYVQRLQLRQVIRVLVGAVIWIIMMLIAYYLLATIPLLFLLGFWVAVALWQLLRPPSGRPTPPRPDEDDPTRALRSGTNG